MEYSLVIHIWRMYNSYKNKPVVGNFVISVENDKIFLYQIEQQYLFQVSNMHKTRKQRRTL